MIPPCFSARIASVLRPVGSRWAITKATGVQSNGSILPDGKALYLAEGWRFFHAEDRFIILTTGSPFPGQCPSGRIRAGMIAFFPIVQYNKSGTWEVPRPR